MCKNISKLKEIVGRLGGKIKKHCPRHYLVTIPGSKETFCVVDVTDRSCDTDTVFRHCPPGTTGIAMDDVEEMEDVFRVFGGKALW